MVDDQFYIGKREQISWEEESTYGNAVTPTEIVGLNARVEPDRSQNWNEILSAGADTLAPESESKGPKTAKFRLMFSPVSFKFMKFTMDVSTSGSGPYTHSLSIANVPKSFTLEWARRGDPNNVVTFTGCVLTNINIEFNKPTGEGEGMLSVTADVIAQDWNKGTSITSLSALSDKPFHYRHTKVTIDSNEITEVASGSINIDRGITEDDVRYANATLDRKIGQPIPKVFRTTGNNTINPKDQTYETLFDNASVVSNCKLEFIRTTDDKISFNLAGFRFKPTDSTNLEGISILEMAWNSRMETAEATDNISTW